MANNETKVLTTNSFEDWRRASNEVSYHLGDVDQIDSRIGDKTYTYSAAANQVFFHGGDSASKILRYELASEVPIDVTSTIIFTGSPTIASNWIAGKTVYQGSVGSESFTGVILYVNANKVALRSTTGTFNAGVDLTQTTDSTHQTIAHANLVRTINESYTTGYLKVYNGATEQAQSTAQVGFHIPKVSYEIALTGTPTIPASFSEGATVYQGSNYANKTWEGVIYEATNTKLLLKSQSSHAAFSASTMIKELSDSGSDRIIASKITSGVSINTTFGSYIELHTAASASAAIKIISTNTIDAIKELQDDIGTVESLTTTAGDLHLAINEHDAELGTISAGAMGTTASTVSTAIAEHETQMGNVDITAIAAGNNTHTGALAQLHTEVGSLSLNTSASDLTAAINEHEADIGNMSLTGLTATNLSAGQRELRTELGDVLTINDATGYAAVSAAAGVVEIQGKIGEVSASNMGTTASTVVTAIAENHTEIGVIGSLAAGITSDRTNLVAAVNELQGDIGTAAISGLGATTLRGAVNELRTELGDVGAINDATGYAATSAVTGLTEIQGKIGEVSASNMGTTASTVVTAISELHTDVDASVRLTSGSAQTLNFDMTYGSNGKSMTFASGTTLDLSNATLLLSAAGNVANFGSAFLNLNATASSGSNVNLQGLQVDRSAISGGANTTDVRLQWDETRVAADPEEAWELQGLDISGSPLTSSIVTRYNAQNLIANNTESGINVTWDSTNENFDFNTDDFTITLGGDLTGNVTITDLASATLTATVAANSVALGTDTTGNYISTITGTANEITVSGSGSETAGVTLSLPDDVTIGDDLTVTDALSVGGLSTLTGNTTIGGTLQVNGNVTLGNAASDTVTITGDLIVQGDETKLNTSTLEVEDTIVMMGVAGAEPSTGGFGIETRAFTGQTNPHANAAANITGTHSLVYNFATDQWEADGSLVLSSATLGVPSIEGVDFESSKNLDFVAGSGITVGFAHNSNDFDVTIANADRGSSQLFYKTFTGDSGSAVASANEDSIDIEGGTAIGTVGSTDKVQINHSNVGAGAATYGQTGTEDGKYIKSVIVNAQGHVTSVTSDDFDDRYNNFTYTHPTYDGDDISLNTSGAQVIDTLTITTDTIGSVSDASVTTRNLNLHDLADTDWGSGGSEPADAAIAIYEATSNTWRDYILSGDISMTDAGVVTVANNSHSHTYSNISDPPTIGDATITLTAGNGLKTGGAFTTNQTADETITLAVDLNELTTDTTIADGDFIPFVDISASNGSKKITFENFEDHIFSSVSGAVSITGAGVATVDYSNVTNTPSAPGNGTITIAGGAGIDNNPGDFTTNQSTAETITLSLTGTNHMVINANDIATDATSANTAGKIVSRDGSGDFSCRNIAATTVTAALSGNATSATALATARTIGGVSFDGSANINLPGVNTAGTQDTSGTATNATNATNVNTVQITNTDDSSTGYIAMFDINANSQNQAIKGDGGLTWKVNQNVLYATDFVASSDNRLKDKVGNLDNALDKVCSLDGFLYTWNDEAIWEADKETVHIGVSAQQVQEILPEAVSEKHDGYLGVKYDKLVPLLIESIKELKAEVEELKSINTR
jgi:hypothetical protein